jgi:hypothetical protein
VVAALSGILDQQRLDLGTALVSIVSGTSDQHGVG